MSRPSPSDPFVASLRAEHPDAWTRALNVLCIDYGPRGGAPVNIEGTVGDVSARLTHAVAGKRGMGPRTWGAVVGLCSSRGLALGCGCRPGAPCCERAGHWMRGVAGAGPSRTPRTNAEAAVLALGNAICGPGGTVETVRGAAVRVEPRSTRPRPRKSRDTPTVAAARRVLAAARAALHAGGKGPAPRAYQREACESAPRLARRVLATEQTVRHYQSIIIELDADIRMLRAELAADGKGEA